VNEPSLTRAEIEVGECRGKGWDCPRIAEWLGIQPSTVQWHVENIAAKLDNPDDLKPMDLVLFYFAHKAWVASHKDAA